MAQKLWEKSVQVDRDVERFTVGKDREMDLYLAPFDILGSLAHISMLQSIGLLTAEELKKWIWPMALAISLPDAVFIYLSSALPDNLWIVNICVFIEQFGYGFGFTAYMLYLIYYSDGEHKTAHYAICTAFMALGLMLPGMAAGWLQEQMGYENFFWWVMGCCLVTLLVTACLKIDPEFGKKKQGNN